MAKMDFTDYPRNAFHEKLNDLTDGIKLRLSCLESDLKRIQCLKTENDAQLKEEQQAKYDSEGGVSALPVEGKTLAQAALSDKAPPHSEALTDEAPPQSEVLPAETEYGTANLKTSRRR